MYMNSSPPLHPFYPLVPQPRMLWGIGGRENKSILTHLSENINYKSSPKYRRDSTMVLARLNESSTSFRIPFPSTDQTPFPEQKAYFTLAYFLFWYLMFGVFKQMPPLITKIHVLLTTYSRKAESHN